VGHPQSEEPNPLPIGSVPGTEATVAANRHSVSFDPKKVRAPTTSPSQVK